MAGQPIRCRGVGHLATGGAWAMQSHAHDFSEVIVVRGGYIAVETPAEGVSASAGDVLLYPPRFEHGERSDGRMPLDLLFFGFTGIAEGGRLMVRDESGRMRVLAEWLLQEQSSAYAQKREVMDALLAAFLAEFAKAAAPQPDTFVESVRGHMREHLAKPLRAEELARQACMSRAHFIRTYRKAAGHPPMEDLRLLRAEAARDLIMTTDLPMKAIAPRVGFSDEYHLSRVFKKLLGVPPGYFRRRG